MCVKMWLPPRAKEKLGLYSERGTAGLGGQNTRPQASPCRHAGGGPRQVSPTTSSGGLLADHVSMGGPAAEKPSLLRP